MDGNKFHTGLYMKELCRMLVPLLHSPLSATDACAVMVKLGTNSFDDDKFGKMVPSLIANLFKN